MSDQAIFLTPEERLKLRHVYQSQFSKSPVLNTAEASLWLFDTIAQEIAQRIRPESSLDIGGERLLVEALMKRGINAHHIDFSPPDLPTETGVDVPESIAALVEPLGRRYDLIVWLESLRGVRRQDAEAIVANLCAHSDKCLLSLRPPRVGDVDPRLMMSLEGWAQILAGQGFRRDFDLDASFISPWAAMFTRSNEPITRTIAGYEGKLAALQRDAAELELLKLSIWWRLWRLLDRLAPQNSVHYRAIAASARYGMASARRVRRAIRRRGGYLRWIRENEPGSSVLAAVHTEKLALAPHFAVVTYFHTPGTRALARTAKSLRRQTYTRWTHHLIRANELSSQASDVTGDFVLFLDEGDSLAPFALFELAKAVNEHPEADVLYTDCDTLSFFGLRRKEPFFKPGWSPEMMLSANYLDHTFAVRLSVLGDSGWLPQEWDPLRKWGLFLRCTDNAGQITHVPKVLCHIGKPSQHGQKARAMAPDAAQSQVESVLKPHLERCGIKAEVRADPSGCARLIWPPTSRPSVSIIIPTRDKVSYLKKCVDSILERTEYAAFEIVIVDNGSREPETSAYLSALDAQRVKVIASAAPFNWSALNNFGVQHASGSVLAFLNNDMEVVEGHWLEELVGWAMQPPIAVAGGLLVRPDDTIQHAGIVLGMGGVAAHPFEGMRAGAHGIYGDTSWYRNYLAVTGACQVIRRELFEQLGRFDETFGVLYSDLEFCVRAWEQGYRIVYTPFAKLLHYHGITRGGDKRMPPRDFQIAYRRFRSVLERGDPYFNPNLSYWTAEPSLRTLVDPNPGDWAAAFVNLLERQFSGASAVEPQRVEGLMAQAHSILSAFPG